MMRMRGDIYTEWIFVCVVACELLCASRIRPITALTNACRILIHTHYRYAHIQALCAVHVMFVCVVYKSICLPVK